MKQHLLTFVLALLYVALITFGIHLYHEISGMHIERISAPQKTVTLASGISTQNFDVSVRPQDDFYRYVNGKWLDTTEIPPDKVAWGAFNILHEQALEASRDIIETSMREPTDTETQKIAALYKSFMDETKIETIGLEPLRSELVFIDSIKSVKEIPALVARLGKIGITAPYGFGIHQDNKDATKYVADFQQSGLGLPDRDYYLLSDNTFKKILADYETYVVKILEMSGDKSSAENAKAIIALETKLAQIQWANTELQDPVKTYNRFETSKLDALAPNLDWKTFFVAAGLDGKTSYVIVGEPSYFSKFNKILKKTSLSDWQSYFRFHLISGYAPYLSKEYVDANFAFYGTVLSGVPENKPRWQRSVMLVNGALGEDLGKLYIKRYFSPESKVRVEKIVNNLLESYRQSINQLDWMSTETKQEAQNKLAKFTTKIGYPKTWVDYSALLIKDGDLVGNVMRSNIFDYDRNINKLGKPIDRGEWHMFPQTVNAYYNPELNEIVFPAAILQPPFFNPKADDAVNYGSIGTIIGHEISHGFDNMGSQYDGVGNLRNWWTPQDREKFTEKTIALITQYNAYEPVKGYHVNGELTLGENIADNSGVATAFKAYHLSLSGARAPVIDGFTGDERFYFGFAQVWQYKIRENEAINRIKTDPHSPTQLRALGALVNQQGFYDTFGVKEGDKMYLPKEKRVSIW